MWFFVWCVVSWKRLCVCICEGDSVTVLFGRDGFPFEFYAGWMVSPYDVSMLCI